MTDSLSRRRFILSSMALGGVFGGLALPGCKTINTLSSTASTPSTSSENTSLVRASVTATTNRRNVSLYAKAVHAMRQTNFPMPQVDADGNTRQVTWWEALAFIHLNNCPHGNWFFLPWHRAYLHYFELACRHFCEEPQFVLPYWDWSADPAIPATFWGDANNPLFDAKRACSPIDKAPVDAVGSDVITKLLDTTDFFVFASGRASALRGAGGATGQLEGIPHNHIHVFVGGDDGDMAQFTSPLDPIFWLHHCNVDRLWAMWQLRMASKGLSSLPPKPPADGAFSSLTADYWSQFQVGTFFDIAADGAATEARMSVDKTLATTNLGYTYDTATSATRSTLALAEPGTSENPLQTASLALDVTEPRGLPTPGAPKEGAGPGRQFVVSKSTSLRELLARCKQSWQASGAGMNLRLVVSNVMMPPRNTTQELVIDLQTNSTVEAGTGAIELGRFAFFGHQMQSAMGATMNHGMALYFDLHQPLVQLLQRGIDLASNNDAIMVNVSMVSEQGFGDETLIDGMALGLEFDA